MIEGLIILASYGFYSGGSFGNLLSQWESMGVFSYMLPFLLIFALVYGILSKMNIFGEGNNKTINAIIALVVGLMALQFDVVSLFFADILPRLGIALAVVLIFLILMGLFGNPNNKGLMNTIMWGAFGIAILISLQSLKIFDGSYTGLYFLKYIPYNWIPYLALLILITAVIGSSKSKSSDTPDSIFVRGLKDQ